MLRLVQKNKKFYYKKLNSFTIRQISSKINTTVFSMTVICLMLFITICVLSSSLTMKNSLNKFLADYAPRDIEIRKRHDPDPKLWGYTDLQVANSRLSIEESLTEIGFDYEKYLKDIVDFSLYTNENVTLKTSIGDYYNICIKSYPFLRYDDEIMLMKNSDYNKLATSFNLEKINLKSDEYIVVGNYKLMITIKNEGIKRHTKITIDGNNYSPKYEKAVHGFYQMTSNEAEIGFIVLPDKALENSKKVENYLVADYNDDSEKIEKIVNDLLTKAYADHILTIDTKLNIKDSSVGLGAVVTFIGLYLGIVFLISCAAILALKELSESSDNKDRFQILRRIGVDEKDLNKALFRQITIFFLFPLALAIIHSIFGIRFCNIILEDTGITFDVPAVITTALIIILIYGGYLLVTYMCSKNIIKEKN